MSIIRRANLLYLRFRINRLEAQHLALVEKSTHERRDLTRKQAKATLALIGSIVSVWTKIETMLDLWVLVIHYEWGKINIQTFLPSSLDRELDYISKAVAGWEFLESFGDRARPLLADLHQRKVFRHNIIHGEYDVFSQDASLKVVLAKVKGNIRRELITRYTSEQMLVETEKLVKTSQALNALVMEISETFIDLHNGAG